MSTDDYNAERDALHSSEIFSIVIGSISSIFPLSVVLILIQRYNTLVRGKSLVHYVLMIAIADTMVCLSIALGFPIGGTKLCSIQGFVLFFFSRLSWLFTDVLIIQLFFVVVFQRYFLNVKYMHCIVWSLNIVLQLLPFSTGTYYGFSDGINYGSCCLFVGKGTYENYYKWLQYTFNIWLLISFSIIIILSIVIVLFSFIKKHNNISSTYLAQRVWSIVILYCVAMMITWVPCTAFFYYFEYAVATGKSISYFRLYVIGNYLFGITALYGPLLSLIFYTKTVDARRAWMHNLRCIINLVTNIEIDDRTTCSSIISIDDRYVSEVESINNIKVTNNMHMNPMNNNDSDIIRRIDDEGL